jgi:hypothetical protein
MSTSFSLNHLLTSQPSKRKADEINEIDSDDDRLCYVTDSCDQVRRKILTFLGAGEMKVSWRVPEGPRGQQQRVLALHGSDGA